MWEMFSEVSAFVIFLGIASIGFLFLLISLIFGEIFEHFDFAHDFDHDLGHGGPGFFSTRVISVFITAFGSLGAITVHYGYSVLAGSIVGFFGGIFFSGIVYLFARFLYSQQASSMVRTNDLVGQTAQVTVAISPNSVGQIRCLIGESVIEKLARSSDGSPIPVNALVTVEAIVAETVVVRPAGSAQPVDRK